MSKDQHGKGLVMVWFWTWTGISNARHRVHVHGFAPTGIILPVDLASAAPPRQR